MTRILCSGPGQDGCCDLLRAAGQGRRRRAEASRFGLEADAMALYVPGGFTTGQNTFSTLPCALLFLFTVDIFVRVYS